MAMDRDAAEAYVFSKVCGMLTKTFTGKRAEELFKVQSLKELWRLVFNSEAPAIPEKLLAKELEMAASNSFVEQYKKLLSYYSDPDDILISLLHSFDYENLKQIGASLCFNEKELPDIVDITPYNVINYKEWPDIRKMTENSIFSWYDKIPLLKEQQSDDARLDSQFVNEVWTAINRENYSCRDDIRDLFGFRFMMDNVIWAMRLKLYYKMNKEQITEHLTFVQKNHDEKDPVAGEAMKILDWDTDDYESWRKWKYSSFLNPYQENNLWQIDPSWVYNYSKKIYVNKAVHSLHQNPFSPCPLICWYIIKQNELDLIRTASECLRMGENQENAMKTAGVMEDVNG